MRVHRVVLARRARLLPRGLVARVRTEADLRVAAGGRVDARGAAVGDAVAAVLVRAVGERVGRLPATVRVGAQGEEREGAKKRAGAGS